jgi:hypothetical protein
MVGRPAASNIRPMHAPPLAPRPRAGDDPRERRMRRTPLAPARTPQPQARHAADVERRRRVERARRLEAVVISELRRAQTGRPAA